MQSVPILTAQASVFPSAPNPTTPRLYRDSFEVEEFGRQFFFFLPRPRLVADVHRLDAPAAGEQPRQRVLDAENKRTRATEEQARLLPPSERTGPPSPQPGAPRLQPCRRRAAPPLTHRAAVRGNVEDEERAARRVRGAGPFPHLVLLHQQVVGRALPLPELHRQSCERRTGYRPRRGPGPAAPSPLPEASSPV